MRATYKREGPPIHAKKLFNQQRVRYIRRPCGRSFAGIAVFEGAGPCHYHWSGYVSNRWCSNLSRGQKKGLQ